MEMFEKKYPDRRVVLENLEKGSDRVFNRMVQKLTQEGKFHEWLKKQGEPAGVCRGAQALEDALRKGNPIVEPGKTRLAYAALMKGISAFSFRGKDYRTVHELAEDLREIAAKEGKSFPRKVSALIDGKGLSPEFAAWLLLWDQEKALDRWAGKYCEPPEPPTPKEQLEMAKLDQQIDAERAREEMEVQRQLASPETVTVFGKLLAQYPEMTKNARFFRGLLADEMPDEPLRRRLLLELYRMDVMKSIRESPEITTALLDRLAGRMVRDLGVREGHARWAAGMWCLCYGRDILGKTCSPQITV